jgi:hypothetical protein
MRKSVRSGQVVPPTNEIKESGARSFGLEFGVRGDLHENVLPELDAATDKLPSTRRCGKI